MRKARFCIVLLFLLLFPVLLKGEKITLVADPAGAVKNTWQKFPVCGRDFWLLLDPAWLSLKGISHEAFVQRSGTGFVRQSVTGENTNALRVMSIGEITCLDKKNKKVPIKIRIVPEEKDTLIFDQEYLTDGNAKNFCVLTADILDIKRRYKSFRSNFEISGTREIAQIVIHHGKRAENCIGKVVFDGKEIPAIKGNNKIKIKTNSPVKNLKFTFVSSPLKYKAAPLKFSWDARLKKAPFLITNSFRHAHGNVLGLSDENFDRNSFAAVRKKYGKNFLGYWMAEWDSNFVQTLARPYRPYYKEVAEFAKIPCNKEELIANFKTVWDAHKPIFGKDGLGLSGQVHFMHYACDWGSTLSAIELTQERPEHAGRVSMMFTRGAARQFRKPMMIYQAYFGGPQSPNSTLRGYTRRLDWGVAPSLTLRNFYAAYYMGNNYLDFEAQVYGMVKKEKDGTHTLTNNGKAMKEIYEWTASKKGVRGECYAPILLLADRKHGYDMWYRIEPNGWGNFYNLYPPTDANFFLEYVMQVISPRYDYYKYDDPRYSGNLHNSTVGDIFDLYVANPTVSGEVKLAQLKKYPVVALIDDITYTENMVNTLKEYVAGGGTLLLTTGQTAPFEEDKEFLGVKIGRKEKKEDELFVNPLTLLPGTVKVMETSKKSPLVTKKKYGKGHVILLASPFMKKVSGKTKAPKQLVKLFEKIQSELLPVKVEGDCQYLFNIMPDGTWKVILINNRGIVKRPKESFETHHKEFTSKVTLKVPSGVTIKELRKNASPAVKKGKDFDSYSFNIAPADIYIVDMKGIKFESKAVKGAAKYNKVKNYKFKPYTPKIPNDGYRKKSSANTEKPMPPAPVIVGSWKSENNMKESSGKGYELKFHNVEVKEGLAHYNTKRSWGTLNFDVKHALAATTYEFVAKPAPANQWWKRPGRAVRGGLLYRGSLMLEYYNGRWALLLYDRALYVRLVGPQAESKWTHICVTLDKNLARLFVNGKEVKNGRGPLKSMRDFGNLSSSRTRTNRIVLDIGALNHSWPNPYSFNGMIKEFTIHGKALSPEEVAKLAKEKLKK